jgi:hypothetical protein
MTKVSKSNRLLAGTVASVFGGTPRVNRYWDAQERAFVDVLSSSDSPEKGVVSYSTLGLSDHPLLLHGAEYEVRAEFVGACYQRFDRTFPQVLSTAALCVVNSKWFSAPGVVFPDILAMYHASRSLSHVFFAPPCLWANLKTVRLPDKTVAWLLVVPISEAEFRLAEAKGPNELERQLAEARIDIFDLERPSVL